MSFEAICAQLGKLGDVAASAGVVWGQVKGYPFWPVRAGCSRAGLAGSRCSSPAAGWRAATSPQQAPCRPVLMPCQPWSRCRRPCTDCSLSVPCPLTCRPRWCRPAMRPRTQTCRRPSQPRGATTPPCSSLATAPRDGACCWWRGKQPKRGWCKLAAAAELLFLHAAATHPGAWLACKPAAVVWQTCCSRQLRHVSVPLRPQDV